MNDTTFQGNGSVKYVPVVVDTKPKPITNADKIRASSDEELADWLVMNGDGSDYQTWLEWLKQEAET